VEVFIQNGRYGIMADGKVTCPAEFRKVRMLKEGYFALGTYPYPAERNKTTVIDRRGRNLEARLYGDVMQAGDMFMAETQSGKAVVWDGKGRRYYDHLPEFERVGNVDMVKEGDMYTLRRPSPLLPTPVAKQEVFYNDKLMIIRDVVILNNEYSTVLKPVYYFGYKMLVEEIYHSRRRYRWLTLKDGLTNQYTNDVYWDSREDPYWKDAQLTNAATGRLQYLNPNFGKKKVAGQ
jgi:hypothetical protein